MPNIRPTRFLRPIALAASIAAAGQAAAQSVNVDFNRPTGPGAGPPASAFTAASGQGGVWNAIQPSSATNGTIVSLTAAGGSGSVVMKHKASNGAASANFGSGDFSKLMADYAFGLLQNGLVEIEFFGLQPGIYDVFVYTGLPQSEAFYTQFGQEYPHTAFVGVHVNGSLLAGTATTAGYVAPPTFMEGVNYSRITTGFANTSSLKITVSADLAYSLAKVGVNGVQLRKWEHDRLHVTTTGAGDKSGRTWADAMADVHTAFAFADKTAGGVKEIWIKGGQYKPSLNDRTKSFNLPSHGVWVRGGFAGTESSIEERTSGAVTHFSGNIGNQFLSTDNSYAVLRAHDDVVQLDRLVIRSGRADGPSSGQHDLAGGLVATHSDIVIQDCLFGNHYGLTAGAIYAFGGDLDLIDSDFALNEGLNGGGVQFLEAPSGWSYLTVDGCIFEDNKASTNGGALQWKSAHDSGGLGYVRCLVDRSRFQGNSAGGFGGAIYATGDRIVLRTSLFNGNQAADGGALNYVGRGVSASGCTVTNNQALQTTGGFLLSVASHPFNIIKLSGSILWGNSSGSGSPPESAQVRNQAGAPSASIMLLNCCVPGDLSGFAGSGSTGANPMFVDADGADGVAGTADDDLRLSPGSPAIDAGVDYLGSPTKDLAGDERKVDIATVVNTGVSLLLFGDVTYVDMGCYEVQGLPAGSTCPADLDGNGAVDAADLAILLGAWGGAMGIDLDGDGAATAADLAILLGAWGACP